MLVQVHWKNDHYDYVEDYLLDSLIEAGAVIRFLRFSGWVTVGRDPIRSVNPAGKYQGIERRSDGCRCKNRNSMR